MCIRAQTAVYECRCSSTNDLSWCRHVPGIYHLSLSDADVSRRGNVPSAESDVVQWPVGCSGRQMGRCACAGLHAAGLLLLLQPQPAGSGMRACDNIYKLQGTKGRDAGRSCSERRGRGTQECKQAVGRQRPHSAQSSLVNQPEELREARVSFTGRVMTRPTNLPTNPSRSTFCARGYRLPAVLHDFAVWYTTMAGHTKCQPRPTLSPHSSPHLGAIIDKLREPHSLTLPL